MKDVLEVLNGRGHLTLKWDPDDPDEVAEARAMVESLKKDGYTFFVAEQISDDEVGRGGGTLLVKRIADPTAEEPEEAPAPEPKSLEDEEFPKPPPPEPNKCQAITAKGTPCSRNARPGSDYCGIRAHAALEGKAKTEKKPKKSKRKSRRTVAVRPMAGG